jgi:hypothetical protein
LLAYAAGDVAAEVGEGRSARGRAAASKHGIADSRPVDDFEDGDLSEYEVLVGPGGEWRVQSDRVSRGSYALQYTGSEGSDIGSYEGFPHYPERGDRIYFDFGTFGKMENHTIFAFGQQGGDEWQHRYALVFIPRVSASSSSTAPRTARRGSGAITRTSRPTPSTRSRSTGGHLRRHRGHRRGRRRRNRCPASTAKRLVFP